MKIVDIDEAKTKFSMLVNEALNGEEIIIAKSGKPVAKLLPYLSDLQPRKGGQFKGLIEIANDFDQPLSQEELDQFYNKDIIIKN